MKYRKKPIIIDAIQWDGTVETAQFLVRWGEGHIIWYFNQNYISIMTLEGTMNVNINDWVIRGTKGEFYPCKPDIFSDIYELVEE